jgi:hypothetical protein
VYAIKEMQPEVASLNDIKNFQLKKIVTACDAGEGELSSFPLKAKHRWIKKKR